MKTEWGSYCRRSRRGEKESIINGYGRYIETEISQEPRIRLLQKKFQIISAFRLESLCAEDLIMAKYRS